MSDEPAVEELGQISDVTVGLAITDRPWELPVDALVVSVGEGGRVGSLGRAVRAVVTQREPITERRTDPAPDPAPLPVEEGSEVATVAAGRMPTTERRLTDDELALLARLGSLVRTPRSATRLLNLYGLLRSTRALHEGGDFLGGAEYQAVAQLLGILVGAPELLDGVVAALEAAGPGVSWWDVVDTLDPALVAGLASVRAVVTRDDVVVYRTWAPRVARFSMGTART